MKNKMTLQEIESKQKMLERLPDKWVDIGKRLREIRERRGYSAKDVADIIGKDTKTIYNHETANVRPSFDLLLKYCALYDCSIGYLLKEYDGTTFDRDYIASQTGLSEEAIKVLTKDDFSNPFQDLFSDDKPIPEKTETLLKAVYDRGKNITRELADVLIRQFYELNSFANNMQLFLQDKKAVEKYEKYPYYEEIMWMYKQTNEGDLRVRFDFLPELEKLIKNDVSIIRRTFKTLGYSESEIDDIDKQTEGFFKKKRTFEATKDFKIANIQNGVIRFLETYMLKEDYYEIPKQTL